MELKRHTYEFNDVIVAVVVIAKQFKKLHITLTQKQLQGFNGTQTQGVSVRASVLCQLSYGDPYIETLTLGTLALSSTSVCNKISLYMSRVLLGLSKLALQQVYGVTSA